MLASSSILDRVGKAAGKGLAVLRLLGPRALAHRFQVLKLTFLDHQFERNSPLPPLPETVAEAIYSHEVSLPPRASVQQPGGQTIEGIFFLASLSKALQAQRIFEFGTFKGVTTWTLARNAPGAEVTTLDLPVDQTPALTVERTDEVVRGLMGGHLYAELPHDAFIEQVWGDSSDFKPADQLLKSVDLVYIDGAHSEDYVRKDTENAYAMAADSGVIVWDDYWREVQGVRKVLHELPPKGLYRIPGTRLVIQLNALSEERLLSSTGKKS